MASPTPRTSARLRRAAEAERAELAKQRAKLLRSRETLRSELQRVESVLDEIGDREQLLERLAGPFDAPLGDPVDPKPAADAGTEQSNSTVLKGPDIRRVAVQVILEHPEHPEALHYREWLDLVTAAGYQVAGKDPNAVFLSQISRSPVVRRATQPGMYSLDLGAPRRLRGELARAHSALAALPAAPSGPEERARVREERARLTTEIDHAEKALAEAEALLGHGNTSSPLAVAS